MVSGGGSTVAERRNQRVASLIAEHELMTGEVNLDLLCVAGTGDAPDCYATGRLGATAGRVHVLSQLQVTADTHGRFLTPSRARERLCRPRRVARATIELQFTVRCSLRTTFREVPDGV